MPSPLKSSQKYTYDPRLGAGGMYRNEKGRIVKNEVIVKELDRVLRGAKKEALQLAADFQNGDIDLQTWYDETRQKLKIIHGLSGALARGGLERMSQSDWGRVGFASKGQYLLLNNFAKQLESGEQLLNGDFLRRVRMYIDAGRSTYFEIRRDGAKQAGFGFERRVLSQAEHCRTRNNLIGCVELADMGWQPIGTLPRIGETPCLSNDKCSFEFRRSLFGPVGNFRVNLRKMLGSILKIRAA